MRVKLDTDKLSQFAGIVLYLQVGHLHCTR
jgi:hypothetical protein